jgi:hypothetical protein
MVFAEAVGFVESALVPSDVELPLSHPVAHPSTICTRLSSLRPVVGPE